MKLFESAIAAADAAICVPPALPDPDQFNRLYILAVGKAAAAMARAAENFYLELLEPPLLSGAVTTRSGYELPCRVLDVAVAGHPYPDQRSVAAAEHALGVAEAAGAGDLFLVLLSGGASALWCAPIDGVSLDDKRHIARDLLASGAAIDEINCVRSHLSRIKGGKLALAAAPAQIVTLAISDVSGDDPAIIGSGPTFASSTRPRAALDCLQKYGIKVSKKVTAALESCEENQVELHTSSATAHPFRIVAKPADAIEAAAASARDNGLEPLVIGADISGEARDLAVDHAELALTARDQGRRLVLLSGGEATVRIVGNGRGGPNQEYALALACALQGAEGIWAIAADSDGTDGGSGSSGDPAGAIIGPQTLKLARRRGLDPIGFLENNDSTGFFEVLGDQLITGPTFTNVNDFRAILVEP